MKARRNKWRRAGSAVFTVLAVIFAVSGVLAVASSSSLQRTFMAHRLADRTRARALADAGIAETYSVLSTNWNVRTNAAAFPQKAYGGGTFDVDVNCVDEFTAVLTCTGVFGRATEVAVLDLRSWTPGSPGADPSQHPAYGYNILADEEIVWTGCGTFTPRGKIHSNTYMKQSGCGELNADCYAVDYIELKGKSGFIDGDAHAPDVNDKHDKVWGTVYEEPVDEIPIPPLDFDAYRAWAAAHGEEYTANKKRIGSDYAPNGGVMWVNGNLKITSQANLTGCFIATGYIDISSSGQHTKVGGYPAFASQDSYISISSQFDMEGLLYTRIGDIDFTGGGSLTGSIICGGTFKKSGNSTVFAYADSAPEAPGAPGTESRLYVTAWQK